MYILLLIGACLLLAPYLLLLRSKKQYDDVMRITVSIFATQLTFGIILQTFHLFTYGWVLTLNIVLLIYILYIVYRRYSIGEKNLDSKHKSVPRFDWVLLSVLIISGASLWMVHHNYTGKYTVLGSQDYQEVTRLEYAYPYFVDEWYAVALARSAIENNALPLTDPFEPEIDSFINVQFPFHSLLATVFVLLNMDPLLGYIYLTWGIGVLTIFIVYAFMRGVGIANVPAGIASLMTLYVVNGATLPGLCYLIPLNLGVLGLILFLYFLVKKKTREILMSFGIILLLYPPLVLFASIGLFIMMLDDRKMRSKLIFYAPRLFLLVLGFTLVLSSSFFIATGSWNGVFTYVLGKVLYVSFLKTAIPQFPFFVIVPILSIIALIIAVPNLIRKQKVLLGVWATSMIFWITYALIPYRLGIGYERIVILTSMLTIILSGFGFQNVWTWLREKCNYSWVHRLVAVLLLLPFLIMIPGYTRDESWMQLYAHDPIRNLVYLPSAPANTYLQNKDIEIFTDLQNKRFISAPWKSTVIGVATRNNPVVTKEGTISKNIGLYQRFVSGTCKEKNRIMRKYAIQYAYVHEFHCQKFEVLKEGSDGLWLYSYGEN